MDINTFTNQVLISVMTRSLRNKKPLDDAISSLLEKLLEVFDGRTPVTRYFDLNNEEGLESLKRFFNNQSKLLRAKRLGKLTEKQQRQYDRLWTPKSL